MSKSPICSGRSAHSSTFTGVTIAHAFMCAYERKSCSKSDGNSSLVMAQVESVGDDVLICCPVLTALLVSVESCGGENVAITDAGECSSVFGLLRTDGSGVSTIDERLNGESRTSSLMLVDASGVTHTSDDCVLLRCALRLL